MIHARQWEPTPNIPETPFQDAIAELARTVGWRVAHFRNSQTGTGRHITPVKYDGKGFPDLVLAHPTGRLIFAEIKSARGQITPDQGQWLDALQKVHITTADLIEAARPPHDVIATYVWRPADWPTIVNTLTFGKATG